MAKGLTDQPDQVAALRRLLAARDEELGLLRVDPTFFRLYSDVRTLDAAKKSKSKSTPRRRKGSEVCICSCVVMSILRRAS